MTQGLHIGAQAYVSWRGDVVADFAVGEAAPGVPMTRQTLMLWLSSGKPITAVAVAQLWEQGRLDLDEPVARHIPAFARHGKEQITPRHVLTHTGGFRNVAYHFPDDDWATIIDKIGRARLEPDWTPGETAGYHALTGWFILGELVQRIADEPFDQYVRRHVFEPAGMDDSWIGMPAARYDAYGDRIGVMMNTLKQPPVPHRWHEKPQVTRPKPGGNTYGPIRELGRFYEMLLAGGEIGGARLLERETVELFTSPHRVGVFDKTFQHTIDWGLGFLVDSKQYADTLPPYAYGPHASEQTFGHSGLQSSTGFADPEHDLVVALVCNGTPGEPKHHKRMQAILAGVYEDLGLGER